jgi:hypothetical protein
VTIAPSPTVQSVLSQLGFTWPDSDEDKIEQMGHAWLALSRELAGLATDAEKHARTVWTCSTGLGVDAFRAAWTDPDQPAASLRDGAAAAAMIAEGLYLAAKIVVSYKLKIIAQVVILAVSTGAMVYGAFFTFGATTLAAPLVRWAVRRALDDLTDRAIQGLLNGWSAGG